MIVQVSDDAERDLDCGIAFYDQHGSQIGDHFLNSLSELQQDVAAHRRRAGTFDGAVARMDGVWSSRG